MSMILNCRRVTQTELNALRSDPSTVPSFLYGADPSPDVLIDLDKSWHAIHFLLNGQQWEGDGPLYDAILGGNTLGNEDVGYGPARFLTPEEVHSTAKALNDISVDDFVRNFDAEELNDNDIYPGSWSGEDDDYNYVRDYFLQLVNFFQKAAANNDAMLLYIN